ncbi:MAG: tetratricopeptide repeat protein [Pyrinomonadaceae bacterium]|nr:tetratricopeptide repeat protein [Pyrinomonadaceae bacterium]
MKRIRLSRRFRPATKFLLTLSLVLVSSTALHAQSTPESALTPEAVETRIQRARALIAAHQLQIAASELESVRASTQDSSVRNITSVMLMSVYLEEGNYGRAEALLEENFSVRSARNGDSLRTYFALAGQAVNGSRTHLGRYRSFGINITDSSLPPEVVNDLTRLRSFLERMIAQAKEIAGENKAYDSLSLLEDVLGVRLSLASDSEDQIKWQGEYTAARQSLAASATQIASLVGISALPPTKAPKIASPSPYAVRRTPEPDAAQKAVAMSEQQHVATQTQIAAASVSSPATLLPNDTSTAPASLNARATKRVVPRYPPLAKQSGTVGAVRVYVVIDENGEVIEVSRSEGPLLLRRAAEDAARLWRFQPTPDASSPIRRTGYLDFNFSL